MCEGIACGDCISYIRTAGVHGSDYPDHKSAWSEQPCHGSQIHRSAAKYRVAPQKPARCYGWRMPPGTGQALHVCWDTCIIYGGFKHQKIKKPLLRLFYFHSVEINAWRIACDDAPCADRPSCVRLHVHRESRNLPWTVRSSELHRNRSAHG